MMHWLLVVCALYVLLPAPLVQAAQDGEFGGEGELNFCAAFSESENQLNQAWALLRERLTEDAYASVKREQRVWLQERPAMARELARRKNISQCQAYALVNEERLNHFETMLPRAQKPSGATSSEEFKIVPRGKPEAQVRNGVKVRYQATVRGVVGYAELRGMGYYAFFDKGAEKCFIVSGGTGDKKLLEFLKSAVDKHRLVEMTGTLEEFDNGRCSLDTEKKLSWVAK